MFELTALITYIAVVIGLFLIPGPAVLLVITRTVQGGRKAGIATGLGVATGDLIHTLGAALGLSAILMTSATAFNLVKWAGACYLVYLGVRAFMAKTNTYARADLPQVTPTQAFFQAVGAEVLNPKTASKCFAFHPQTTPFRHLGLKNYPLLFLAILAYSLELHLSKSCRIGEYFRHFEKYFHLKSSAFLAHPTTNL